MPDAMDPLIWTERAPLPDPTLIDFFSASLPESPEPLHLPPDTPSNSTHPWESEIITLQQQNSALQGKLADVPRLLEQLERQKAELAYSRGRLIAIEKDKAKLQDRLDKLERTAKRPRVDNLCCNCAKKRTRTCGITEWLDRFALVEKPDFEPEVCSFITILKEEKRDQLFDKVPKALYNCLVNADGERSARILHRIAAGSIMESATISALVDRMLCEVKKGLHQGGDGVASTKDVVRVLLQGAAAGIWTKRTVAEFLACFIAPRRKEGDLLRVALSSNERMVTEVLIENTDGRDLNLLWGPSLQAVLTFFTANPDGTELSAGSSSREAFLSRWNNVRTTVEDLQDHASLCDAEKALLLEWSMSTADICFLVAVKKALIDKVGGMTTQTEKMEKMLGLVASLMTVLKRDESESMQKHFSMVARWLVSISCGDNLAPRLAATAVNMATDLLPVHGSEEEEEKELETCFVRFSQRQLDEEARKLLSKKAEGFLARVKG